MYGYIRRHIMDKHIYISTVTGTELRTDLVHAVAQQHIREQVLGKTHPDTLEGAHYIEWIKKQLASIVPV